MADRVRDCWRCMLLFVARAGSCNTGQLSQSHACMMTPDLSVSLAINTPTPPKRLHADRAGVDTDGKREFKFGYRKLERACAFYAVVEERSTLSSQSNRCNYRAALARHRMSGAAAHTH